MIELSSTKCVRLSQQQKEAATPNKNKQSQDNQDGEGQEAREANENDKQQRRQEEIESVIAEVEGLQAQLHDGE